MKFVLLVLFINNVWYKHALINTYKQCILSCSQHPDSHWKAHTSTYRVRETVNPMSPLLPPGGNMGRPRAGHMIGRGTDIMNWWISKSPSEALSMKAWKTHRRTLDYFSQTGLSIINQQPPLHGLLQLPVLGGGMRQRKQCPLQELLIDTARQKSSPS